MARLSLEILPPHPQAGAAIFDDFPVRIGSDPTADLSLPEPAESIPAPEHACIDLADLQLVLEDRGSEDGTFVNGESVQRRILQDGDLIALGLAGPQLLVRIEPLDGVSDETIKTVLPQPSFHAIHLTVRSGGGAHPPVQRDFQQPVITVGRDPNNDIDFSDPPHPVVSRYHAEIVWKGSGYQLLDRHATNGTRVNGRLIHSVTLHHGDRIELGSGGPVIEVTLPVEARGLVNTHALRRWLPAAVAGGLALVGATWFGWHDGGQKPGDMLDAIAVPPTEEQFIAAQVKLFARAMNNDIDVVPHSMVQQIERHIHVLTGEDRQEFLTRLKTARALMPVVEQILVENGLPAQLAYIAFQESRFDPHARSQAGAVGLWQFMRATGREYGLVINKDTDERLDPVKSTRAAARYLKKLYLMYGDFMIALAAYNFGPRNVNAALIQIIEDDPLRNRNYWYLVEKDLLPKETDEYVHKIMAGWIVATHPERFGFPVELAMGGAREAPGAP